MKKLYFLIFLFFGVNGYSQFTAGNLVVYRIGDGSAVLTTAATAIFLDEYTPSGTLVQSIALPTTASGSNKRITGSGTATSEGLISRSADGQYILVTGYDAAVGTASVTGTTGTATNRVIARVNSQGAIDVTTALTDFASTGNARSVTSTNGIDFWVTGSSGGIRYATLGGTTSTQLSTTPTNLRSVKIFSGQLYTSTQSGSIRLGTIGSGTPTTSGQTITNLPGFPTSTGSPYDFFFADLNPNVAGDDVLYVADDGSGTGFQKYSLVGGTWVSNGNISVTNNGLRGLTATVSGTTVTLYGVNGPSLIKLVDATGYNTTISGTSTIIASASTNTAFRGIALAPIAAAASPSLSTTTFTPFGNTCVNTTAGPNSFTINGTNLTNADVTVGPSDGYTFSTTANGTYTSSLAISQPGGTFSQQVFVKFTPTLVQAYNNGIPVGGGGTAVTFNVSGTGAAGISSTPTVSTGVSSSITPTSVSLAGSVTANSCATVTAYGIEYSTTAGFAGGTGTQVSGTNLSGTNFSVSLTNLFSSQQYYYKAYATAGGNTVYGSEQTFTTAAGTVILTATSLTDFGTQCINTSSAVQSFTLTAVEARSGTISNVPKPGYGLSLSSTGPFNTVLNFPTPAGNFSQVIYVQFTPSTVGANNTNLQFYGAGTAANFLLNVPVTGEGVNSVPRLTTDGVSSILSTSAMAAGTITSPMCSPVTAYGFEYSTDQTFTTGVTQVPSSNISGSSFTASLTGLQPSTLYYVRAYAINNGGTGYGGPLSFTTANLNPALSTTTPAAFGAVCINTTPAANSFTISGSNLSAADITVGAVQGYTYSTSAAGTYSNSLTLSQPGGAYNQTIYVKFTPTAVSTYLGNVTISGGGANSVTVALSGSGINTAPSVTTGGSSNISSTSVTANGTITGNGCSAITAYGIEYSTNANFVGGTGTQVASNNFLNQNFSASLTGLTPSTTYYFRSYATNNGGTVYGAIQPFTTLTPSFTVGSLTGFGSQCVNTTSSANSFTITGTNLTAASVTVASLAGYTFSTTSGGTYTNSLSLTQPGGAFSQTVFVKFTPTAAQAYNGNIVIGGGGATSANVAVSGTGINTPATVVTGGSSAVTFSAATLAGTISSTGCSNVTAYGIEYSTTSGFANGAGTQVASTNLSGTGFTSSLSGLTASTTYYYKAFATNGGGTVYGAQQSFTTATPPPAAITTTSLAGFGSACLNTTPAAGSFTITGVNLTNAPVSVGPLAGFTFATTANGTYSNSLTLNQPGGAFTQQVFVKFTPTLAQLYSGNIPVSGGGASATTNVAVTGTGVNTTPTLTTGTATNITTSSATLAGTVTDNGCSNVTAYGVEYSGINGFAGGSGTKVAGNGIANNAFTVPVNGLVQGTTYYYRAFATNAGGTAYGTQQTVVITAIPDGTKIFPSPLQKGQLLNFSQNKLAPGYYGIQLLNSMGQEVYRKDLNIQVDFINEKLALPASLPSGIYKVRLVSNTETIVTKTIFIF